ncbi:hypothetical protein ACQ859_02260 [Roseateles chitinivorans]|uniref:hypothetical protein n=1 Tax=Roseateles chitinivorans TaxID=2917965 RepID=UPI003D66C625
MKHKVGYGLAIVVGALLLHYLLPNEFPGSLSLAFGILFYGLLSYFGGLRIGGRRDRPGAEKKKAESPANE